MSVWRKRLAKIFEDAGITTGIRTGFGIPSLSTCSPGGVSMEHVAILLGNQPEDRPKTLRAVGDQAAGSVGRRGIKSESRLSDVLILF